jgi:hypothetical protein
VSAPAVIVVPLTVEALRALIREEVAAATAPTGDAWIKATATGLEAGARRRLTREGKLPTFKRGRVLWVKRADLDACLEDGRVERDDAQGDGLDRALARRRGHS